MWAHFRWSPCTQQINCYGLDAELSSNPIGLKCARVIMGNTARRCNSVGLEMNPNKSVVLITPKSRVRDYNMKSPSPLRLCFFFYCSALRAASDDEED